MKKNRNKFKRDYFKTAVRTRATRVIMPTEFGRQ